MLNFIGLLEQTLQYSSVQLIAYAFFPFSTDQQSHEDDWIPHLKATKDKRSLVNIYAVSAGLFTLKK